MAVRIEKQAEPIPGYRLLDRLGGGGFGEVWKAEAPGGLLKAIKFVYGDLQDSGDDGLRAEQELKALRRVQTVRHPYVLSLERYDIVDGQLMIVMELADKNLWDRYKECRAAGLPGIARDELLGYMDDTAEALDLMNLQYGLQHLDIKPQNLFVIHNHVKVADFGLVKDLEGMKASVTGGVTPVYAAPETFDGWVSRFSDQYSLAIVYQELLTGTRPFLGNNVRQLVLQHLQGTPDLSSLPEADQFIIARGLAKDPEERFPTCKEMVVALRQAGLPGAGRPRAEDVPDLCSVPTTPSPPRQALAGQPGAPPFATPPGGDASGDVDATPRDLIESGVKPTFCIRLRDEKPTEAPVETAHEAARPADLRGDGCLFPALVIGVGGVGLAVLRRLRAALQRRFGSLDALPNVRLLLLDTDPGAQRAATQGETDECLLPQEVFLTPLNRPAHYLKARDGRAALDTWLDSKMLYRIPRSRLTMGVRALGRLAFCDNYRIIARRLRAELEACLDPLALTEADRHTRLGLRSNRPRVYLVASLSGGTGGGMFLDLAYAVRSQLKQLGYAPDVVGLLAAPAAEGAAAEGIHPEAPVATPHPRQVTRQLGLGNTYAALTELRYFARPGKTFQARYYDREPGLQDPEPPFNRTLLLSLGSADEDDGVRSVAERAGDFLARDLASPLEPAADRARADLPAPPWAERGLFCQTFGLFQWSAPLRQLVQHAGRSLCARLLQRWMSKDATPIRERVAQWAAEQWVKEGWSAEAVGTRLNEAGQKVLGRPPEEAFAAIVEPLARLIADVKEAKGRGVPPPPVPDLAVLGPVVEELESLVGWPPAEEVIGRTARLPEELRDVVQGAVGYWGRRVAQLAIAFIEQPEFRLAGAEEAVRQVIGLIEKVLAEHEPRSRDLAAQAADAYERLRSAIIVLRKLAMGKTRQVVTAPEVLELLLRYARLRYQSVLAQQLIGAYVSLRGQLSDQLREINFCRVRLAELFQAFGGPSAADPAAAAERRAGAAERAAAPLTNALFPQANGTEASTGTAVAAPVKEPPRPRTGRCLFPNGCPTLEAAVIRYLEEVAPEALAELDARVQATIERQFTALVQVCMASANVVQNLEEAMRREAEAFVAEHAAQSGSGAANVAELFLTLFADPEAARGELARGFEEAGPNLRGMREFGIVPAETTVLVAPEQPASEEIRGLIREAVPGIEFVPGSGGEDLVLYREIPFLPLGGLEQLGPAAEEAYRQMLTANHFTPHTRIDIPFKSL
jgi:serine/threonine protein kinase